MKYTAHRHRHRVLFFLMLFLVVSAIVFGWRTFVSKGGEVASVDDQNAGPITGRPSPKVVTARTLIFGDVFVGGEIDEQAKATSNRYEYPFKSLENMNRKGYEAWIAGLECPLTDTNLPISSQSQSSRTCATDYASEMKKWLNVVALGNDHTDDQGAGGYAKTREVLESAQLQYMGNPDQSQYGDICEIVNLPARYTLNDSSFKEATMPLALCSVSLGNAAVDDLAIDEVRAYSKILPTWVYAHSAMEVNPALFALERESYHSFIDAGASVVVASHSETTERIESYKGKLIVYSLGSFIGTKSDDVSFGLGVEISAQLDQSVLLWTRLSPECQKFDDACIETAAYQGLTLPKYSYKFTTVSFTNDKDYSIVRASSTENEKFQSSIGWSTVIDSLKY